MMSPFPHIQPPSRKSTRFALPLWLAAISTWMILLCGSSSAQAPNTKSVAQAVDEHYNQLQSSKAAFTEIYQAPGISRTESGTVWLKKSGKMRWEYHEPREKLFLTDSQNAYFYVPGELQARKTSLKKIDDLRSPLRYLLGKTKLEKELDGLSFAPDITPMQAGNVVLRGIPKAMADRISEVLLEINQARQITRIVIRGTDGANTEFRFTGIEDNVPVPDKFFRFSPPPGVATIPDEQTSQ
jgi:outer membrane lipoprotein carrier protein